MRLVLAFIALLAVAAPATAQTSVEMPPPLDQIGLEWERRPSIERVAQLFPPVAWRAGHRRGLARLSCTTQSNGRVRCTPIEEAPEDFRFGEVAVQVMDRVIVRPTDGHPVEGRTFGYTIRFGYWPPRLLPDSYHPSEAGLRWVVRPDLSEWEGRDYPEFNVEPVIIFDCVARSDGSLGCTEAFRDPENVDGIVEGLLASLASARVQRIDGGSPEGVRFRWGTRLFSRSYVPPAASAPG